MATDLLSRAGITFKTYNGKVVEATLADTKFNFMDYATNIFKECKLIGANCFNFSDRGLMARAYIGRAYCNGEAGDTFDEATGKRIAKSRALETFYEDFDKRTIELIEDLRFAECALFAKLRRAGKTDIWKQARSVEEIYKHSFVMPDKDASDAIADLTSAPVKAASF